MSEFLTVLGLRLRRDRVLLPIWILSNAAMAAIAAGAVAKTYGDEGERVTLLATVMANPVILLFRGLPSGADIEAFTLFLILPFLIMIAAFMSTFLAVRHTRAEEDDGRSALVSATPAGRMLGLYATLVHGVVANVATAALIAATFVASGFGPGGAVVAGLAVASAGIVFLAAALLCAQLFATARPANSASVTFVLITFVMCGIGNAMGTPSADLTRMTSSALTWFSPFGWAENTRPYDANQLAPLLLCVAVACVFLALAIATARVRDDAGSLVPARRGRQAASRTLAGSTSLTARLTWTSVLWWAVGAVVAGALSTSLTSVVSTLTDDNPALERVLTALGGGDDLAQGVTVVFFTMIGALACCCAVQVMNHARAEEARGTLEPVWATPVSRLRWLSGYLLAGAIGVVVVCAAGVLGAVSGMAKTGGDSDLMRTVLAVAAGQAVAALVFVAMGAALFVFIPRLASPVSWGLVVVAMVLGFFGPLFGLPESVAAISPLSSAPMMTPAGADPRGLWAILTFIIVATAAAATFIRRRELVPAG